MSSVLLQGGFVIDGTGNPGEILDIYIEEDKIVEIGSQLVKKGAEILKLNGMVVTPGFIDIHSHTEDTIFRNPHSDSKLLQGVTSEVICLCGMGPFPLPQEKKENWISIVLENPNYFPNEKPEWEFFEGYKQILERNGVGTNLLPLVPHGTLRICAMGYENRVATFEELEWMEKTLVRCLKEGAWGISVGLEYPPGNFSDQNELIALAKIVAQYDGMFASHLKNEDFQLISCIEDLIQIGRKSGVRIQVSHLKAVGVPNWGKAEEALCILKKAKFEGVRIGIDQYPYDASSTFLSLLVPEWAHEGGNTKMIERLGEDNKELKNEIQERMNLRGGPQRILVMNSGLPVDGGNILKLSEILELNPVDAVICILIETNGLARGIFPSMSENEVAHLIQAPEIGIGSDGSGLRLPEDSNIAYHPRHYGAFSRILEKYVYQDQILSLEMAIHKMTLVNANAIGLKNRGQLKEGNFADLLIFSPAKIKSPSDYSRPHQYSQGMQFVMINGRWAVWKEKITSGFYGKVLARI